MTPADIPPQSPPPSPWGDTPAGPQKPEKPARPAAGGDSSNPFGRKPAGGGPGKPGYQPGGAPPDLDELVRRSRERLHDMLPHNQVGMVMLVLAILAGLWLSTGFYRVQEGQIGVVLRFGHVTRTAQPGLRFHLPYPIETALTPNVTFENRIEIGFRSNGDNGRNADAADSNVPDESVMLTADQNIIDLDFAVTWVVKDPIQYLFEIRDPEITVKRAAESAMRETVGQTDIQSALTESRDEIQRETKTLLQEILDSYKSGIEIVRVELLRVNPPGPVVDAFNDVQRAEADRERLRNEAEAYRNKIIPEARGEAERLRNEALGYQQQVVNRAKGEASRFTEVLGAYDNAREVTMQRLYIDMMQDVLKNRNKVILENRGAATYLPLGQLAPAGHPGAASAPAEQPAMQLSGPRVTAAPAVNGGTR